QAGDVLVVADEELAGLDAPDVARAGAIVVIGTTLPAWARHAATVVLPITNVVEEEGTFTNLRGRVQRFRQARSGPGFSRPSWAVAADLLAALGESANYLLASEVFDALAAAHSEFAGMSYEALGLKGALVAGAGAGAVA
ncbi:MAG: molybdopterin-dependent oxidoreductase, partial [Gemmatimonadota bacterium]|nr:molybdopterin-dependent oxidoreductase [Gemmatimonadota bacterium]